MRRSEEGRRPHASRRKEAWSLEQHGKWLEGLPAAHFEPLFDLLPLLEGPPPHDPLCEAWYENNPATLNGPNPQAVDELIQLCYDLQLMIVFDWPTWKDEVPFYVQHTLIDGFGRTECCMALTALVRGDRFTEGLVEGAWVRGVLARIVGRLAQTAP